ncbi:MAG: hypothetical protein LBQ16_04765, partial [Gracilibacteraceae bacterium]|nr:hypothetical protein [Gracilibacteraceae bacterium]
MNNESSLRRAATAAAFVAAVFFTVYRVLVSAFSGELWQAEMAVMAGLISLAATVALSRAKHEFTTAFFVPLLLLSLYILTGFTLYGFYNFPLVYLSICFIALLYFQRKAFLLFLATGALLTSALLFAVPLTGLRAAETIPDGSVFAPLLFASALLYLICAYGSGNNDSAAQARNAIRTLMATTSNITALVDGMNCVRYISKPLADMAALEYAEIAAGRPLIDLFRDREVKNMVSEILDGNGLYEGTKKLNLGGETRYFKITSSKLSGGKGAFIDIADITSVMAARVAAETASRSKSDFLAIMSHEIRTPMNAIIGMTNIAKNTADPLRKDDCLQKIETASAHLLGIINDI